MRDLAFLQSSKLTTKTNSMHWTGRVVAGAGGASRAFAHADGRRCREVEQALGFRPFPGSLNIRLAQPFDWLNPSATADVLDLVHRSRGLDSAWRARRAQFYEVTVNGVWGVVFRFEDERYPRNFIEVLAPVRLRDHVSGHVVVCRTP